MGLIGALPLPVRAFVAIGVIAAVLTVQYAVGDDLVRIAALQSTIWAERANRLGLAALLLNLEAIMVAGASLLYLWIVDRQRDREFRVYFLRALRDEVELNQQLVAQVPPVGSFEDAPMEFWDPTRQEFRMRDDASTYAVIEGQARLRLPQALFAALLDLSHAIRFVNQQTEEVFAFRFNSPEMLADVSESFRSDAAMIGSLAAFARLRAGHPALDPRMRAFANELAFRHWALHYFGYAQLRPQLDAVLPLVHAELRALGATDSTVR